NVLAKATIDVECIDLRPILEGDARALVNASKRASQASMDVTDIASSYGLHALAPLSPTIAATPMSMPSHT
ncbi:hypothetical protein BGZ52_005329, partial [Haplosporangium bisporale]